MSKHTTNTNWVLILGHPFQRSELIKFFVLILSFIILISAVAIFYVKSEIAAREDRVEAIQLANLQAEAQSNAANDLAKQSEWLEAYLVDGTFREMQSFLVKGSLKFENFEVNLSLSGKQPNRYRQQVERNGRISETGFDGQRIWHLENFTSTEEVDESILEFRKMLSLFQVSFPYLAWFHMENAVPGQESAFKVIEKTEWEEKTCYVIRNSSLLSEPVYHYIDEQSGLEVYRRISIAFSDGTQKEIEIFYQPPAAEAEYPICQGYKLYVDGDLYAEAEFNKFSFNLGLMDFFFEEEYAADRLSRKRLN
jgi:hypothetical protein